MRTDKQIQASRANGKKSLGPVTPEGKRISSRNAQRHGLLTETIVLEGEAEERFRAMLARSWDEFHPLSDSERTLVEAMTVAKWRQIRVWGMETAHLSGEIRDQETDPALAAKSAAARAARAVESLTERSRALDLLNRYEARFDRAWYRARRELIASKAKHQNKKFQTNLTPEEL
jgi:enoyl-CoA hydratase/carnithine racemase